MDKFDGLREKLNSPYIDAHSMRFTGDFVRDLLAERDSILLVAEAAMAFIDSNVSDPDITEEMCKRYAELQATNPRDVIKAAKRQEGVSDGTGS